MRDEEDTLQLGARIDQSSRSFQAVNEDDVVPCVSDRVQLEEQRPEFSMDGRIGSPRWGCWSG